MLEAERSVEERRRKDNEYRQQKDRPTFDDILARMTQREGQ